MEITNVSSEELSSYSFIHDSPSSREENKRSKDNFGPRRNSLFISSNHQPLQSLKKLRPISEPSLKNSIKSLNTHESKKLPAKSNRKESAKDNLKVSAGKVKLANRPFKGVGSLSTNSAVLGNPSSSKRKEPRQFSSKNKANNLGNAPALDRTETIRSGSKGKTNEVIEIEVFMPVIDVENNTITYPKSTKPIVKRYSPKNNVSKSRDNTHEKNHLIKKNKDSANKSYLYAKTKRDARENSNKNSSNFIRKGNVATAVKTSFSKRGSIGKDIKHTNSVDLGNKKTASTRRPSVKDVNTADLARKKTIYTDRTQTEPGNATNSEKQKVVAEFQNLLRDITFDAENVPRSNEETQSGHANFCQSSVEKYLREVSCEKLSEGGKNVCPPEQKQVHKVGKLQSAIACNFVQDGNIALRQHTITKDITDSIRTLTDYELDKNSRKDHRQHDKKPKSKGAYRDTKHRNARKYKHLYYEKIALERKESNFSSPGSLTNISSNENGWRRTTPKTSFSSECFPQKSKWRRNVKEEELSMDCWIERSKYLQSRQQCFQMKTQTNNWRPS